MNKYNNALLFCTFRRAKFRAQDFSTRNVFWTKVKQYGEGMIIHVESVASSEVLSQYFHFLQEGGSSRIFKNASHLGVVGDTLVLSNEVSFTYFAYSIRLL